MEMECTRNITTKYTYSFAWYLTNFVFKFRKYIIKKQPRFYWWNIESLKISVAGKQEYLLYDN